MSTATAAIPQQMAVNSGIPGVMPQSPDAVWIISIFPFPREHELQLGRFQETEDGMEAKAGFRKFYLEPAARTRHRILKVEGGLKWLMDYANVGEGANDAPSPTPIWQSAEIVASSLVTIWTKHTLGVTGSPGIEILQPADMLRDDAGNFKLDNNGNPIPTSTCLSRLKAQQTVYAESCVQRATDLHTQGKMQDITGLDRGMAEWLYGTGAQKLPWFPKQEFRELKECPACGKEILAPALKCEFCQENLPKFYIEMHIDPSGDPVVATAIRRIQEARESAVRGNPVAALPSEITAIEAKPQNTWTREERDKIREHRRKK